MDNKYLPIGSVVKLKNSDNLIMITGYYSVEYESGIIIYEYSGCSYPEGLMVKHKCISFNHEDIENVVFKGYVNDDYLKVNSDLISIDEDIENTDYVEEKFEDANNTNDNYNEEDIDSLVGVEFDNLDEVINEKAEQEIEVQEINTELPHYDFDESGIILNANNDDNEVETLDNNVELNNNQEFSIPHYEFDENGIIITD